MNNKTATTIKLPKDNIPVKIVYDSVCSFKIIGNVSAVVTADFCVALNRPESDDVISRLPWDVALENNGSITIGCSSHTYNEWKRIGYHIGRTNNLSESDFDVYQAIVENIHRFAGRLNKTIQAAQKKYNEKVDAIADECLNDLSKVVDEMGNSFSLPHRLLPSTEF